MTAAEAPSPPPRSFGRRLRQAATLIVLLAATGVSVVGVSQALRSPRLAADSFNRLAFHKHLSEAQLDRLTPEQVQELARLLERDVSQGRLWLPEIPPDSKRAGAFHRNFDDLAARWARLQAADFARLPQEDRKEFAKRRSSSLRRLLRAANYLDMRTLTALAGREPPPAILDLPRGWVHEELLRWEREAPRGERERMRQFRQAMEPQAIRRGRRVED